MAMMVMMATIMFNGEPVLTNLVISAISSPAATSLQRRSIVMMMVMVMMMMMMMLVMRMMMMMRMVRMITMMVMSD